MLIDVNKINGKYEVTPNKPVDDNKEVTINVSEYVEPVEVTSDALMRKATVTLQNIPTPGGNVQAEKSVTLSTNNTTAEVTPDNGYNSMGKVNVTVQVATPTIISNENATIDVSTYTEPVEVTPSSGDGMAKATVTVTNIPVIEANVAESIDVSSYTTPVEIEPTVGKDGMAKATVTLTNIPSPGGNVEPSKPATINVSNYSGPVTVTPTSGYNSMAQTVITLSNLPQGGDPLYMYGPSGASDTTDETVLVPEELSHDGGVLPYLYHLDPFGAMFYYENVQYAYNEDYGDCDDKVYEFYIGGTTVYTDTTLAGTVYAKSIPQYPVAIFGSSQYIGAEGSSYAGNLFACTSATYLSGNGGTASGYIYVYDTDTWTYVSNETYTFLEASGDCEENHLNINSVGIIANTYNPSTNRIEPSVVMPTTPGGN